MPRGHKTDVRPRAHAPRKGVHIGPRQLFVMLQSLSLAMKTIKGSRTYDQLYQQSPDDVAAMNDAHDLFLELEEQWDALPDKDRRAATAKPFNV